jgi:hypothetical protein
MARKNRYQYRLLPQWEWYFFKFKHLRQFLERLANSKSGDKLQFQGLAKRIWSPNWIFNKRRFTAPSFICSGTNQFALLYQAPLRHPVRESIYPSVRIIHAPCSDAAAGLRTYICEAPLLKYALRWSAVIPMIYKCIRQWAYEWMSECLLPAVTLSGAGGTEKERERERFLSWQRAHNMRVIYIDLR